MVSERVKIINTHLSKLFSNIHNNLFNFLYYCNKLNEKIGKVATSNRCAMPSFSLTERLRLYRKVLWLMQAWSSSLELWNFFQVLETLFRVDEKLWKLLKNLFRLLLRCDRADLCPYFWKFRPFFGKLWRWMIVISRL